MIPIAYRKVWRDLWRNKGRTILVLLSIAAGVTSIGMIFSSNSRAQERMSASHVASQPAHIYMWLGNRVNADTIASLARVEGVEAVGGISDTLMNWRASPDDEWQEIIIKAVDDYEAQTFDLIELWEGSWPSSKTATAAYNHVKPFGLPGINETIFLEVNERPRPITIVGTVRDPMVSVPPFETRPYIFTTMATLEDLTGVQGYDQLRVRLKDFDPERAEAVASAIEAKLAKQEVNVGFSLVQPPDEHWASQQVEGVGLILTVMAIASLFLSVILVINTINALMAQQIPQIGIMKAIGGLRPQITAIYISGVLTYGLLSIMIAVPLGAFAGKLLSNWILGLVNVTDHEFSLNLETVMLQVAAGLLVPLVAGLWPVLRGVAISVHTAISQYGLGGGRYGTGRIDRLLGRVQRLPRMLTLAVRNTFRRSGRVALTLLVLITAGAIFIMVLSAQNSFSTMVDDAWRSLGFDAFIVFDQPERIEEVIPLIESQPNVAYVEMWLWTDAVARIPGSDSIGDEEQIWIRAIPTDSRLYSPDLTDGRELSDQDEHAILLNQKIAGDLGVEVGDQIELDFGARGESTWTVVGLIFDITDMQSTAYAHIHTIGQELNLVGRAYVAEIQLSGNGIANETAFVEDIEVFLEAHGIDVTYARTASQDRSEAESQFQIVTTVLMVMTILMAVVGSIGLSGTLSINVIERRREIGVMRAVGASSMDVAIIFIYEGLLLGLLSWVIATPVGFLLGSPFVRAIGAVFEVPMEHEFAFIGVWIWLIIVLVLSLVASWLPARRATRISVNESLAYE